MVAKIFILELGSNPGMVLSPKEGNNVVSREFRWANNCRRSCKIGNIINTLIIISF